jgi:hypothetical protein
MSKECYGQQHSRKPSKASNVVPRHKQARLVSGKESAAVAGVSNMLELARDRERQRDASVFGNSPKHGRVCQLAING